ncbi:pali-domain-containing protein [Obba rivulosa]|uniref:Pali-domain-containing protein n=1 Tax=Obba rivulosa TaxID=1052685 RepID=A0A8E2DVH7_9APHY|nr:pali-domain-containing protein [Obba rivulosa]
MGIIRPATPGFLVTLVATALLAVVVFSVPYFKSVFFLKASLSVENINGSVTFGVLGYCMELPNGTTCSKPSVGYELNVNQLLGDNLPIQIPNVLVKWITYALVLHIVALVLAAVSAVFGLLAHVREMSMAYCSTCVSGFAAAIALVAFIFDIALFFITKSRINNVQGGSATIGNGIWLTLAAWLLLFFAGCFYGLGRCCVQRRPRGEWGNREAPAQDPYAEQMRLDAIKAEADRKARQKQGEVGLPAFQELEQMQPLTGKLSDEQYVDDGDQVVPLNSVAGVGAGTAAYTRRPSQSQPGSYTGGYAQAPPGTRAVDAYYNTPASPPQQTYPPRPSRQGSAHTQGSAAGYADPYAPRRQPSRQASGHSQGVSGYAPSTQTYGAPTSSGFAAAAATGAGVAGAAAVASQYATGNQYGHVQQPTAASYGHAAGGSSYNAGATHTQYSSAYTSAFHDPYAAQSAPAQTYQPDAYSSVTYSRTPGPSSPPMPTAAATTNPYLNRTQQNTLDGNRGLGVSGYGSNTVPQYGGDEDAYSAYSSDFRLPSPGAPRLAHAPSPIDTRMPTAPSPAGTSPRGPRPPSAFIDSPVHEMPEPEGPYADSPPMYDAATAQPPGEWSAKH